MTETLHNARTVLTAIRAEMQARFIERDTVIDGLLAALLAGEHVLLLGPVGTAKSMLASELCRRVEGASYFQWLLTKFSTPEEIFGPVSLAGLENDDYRRVTSHKLPEAHIAFLDEVFKASSAILNALLSLMNERLFHNGASTVNVPLISLVGASNELPESGELSALYDRFLVRFVVDYIQEDFRFLKMLGMDAQPETTTTLSIADLHALREATRSVTIAEFLLGDLVELRTRLHKKGIVCSDRRYRQALDLMRGYAMVNGRDAVNEHDFEALKHVLWNDPSEIDEVQMTLAELVRGHEDEARDLLSQAKEVRAYALRNWQDQEMAMRASIEAHTKLKNLLVGAERLLSDAQARARNTDTVVTVVETIREIQREILEGSLQM